MPIRPPTLDDRSFGDLVDELIARIPAHTPEWTNPRLGDPGRTMIELFAWLADTLLYRANLIPERQRLVFLSMLGTQLRPAVPARGLVTLHWDDDETTRAVTVRPRATVRGPVSFETGAELTVLPVTMEAYHKRPLTPREEGDLNDLLPGLQQVYQLEGPPVPYVTTPVFVDGLAAPGGFDVVGDTVDGSLWLALLAPSPELVEEVRTTLGGTHDGRQRLLSVGVVPAVEVPALFEEIGPRARLPHVWEMSTGREIHGEPEYLTLDVIHDSTAGLSRRGVIRMALPAASRIGAPANDARLVLDAGVGDRPPRLDPPERAERLVAWLRLRPMSAGQQAMRLSWVGINAAEIDQRQTITGQVVGASEGTADQEFPLPGRSVERDSFELQVEETGLGYRSWQPLDELATAGPHDPVYVLDAEAGTVRFGDGVRGRIPEAGRRVRVATMRAGGGVAGNLPGGTLTEIDAHDLHGSRVTRLAVKQPLATAGGEDAETLEQAERRIPALFRHRNRAVTEMDYRRLAEAAPGVRVGRVEVLPRFKPHQRREDVPGVVSVMVLPFQEVGRAPNPRVDRPFLEALHAYLDPRRPLAAELYVIGCEYVAVGLSVGLTVRDGFGSETVVTAVREALRRHLWPLAPHGPLGEGWPLGAAVRDRELEVVVSRVPGVATVAGVNLFEQRVADGEGIWRMVPRPACDSTTRIGLARWQLPELLSVVVAADEEAPEDLLGPPSAISGRQNGVAVPVVPEVC
jgi:predicted phage baseplate assembly protein